ncbi:MULTISPECIES: hypothetical protein [Enterobacteriaceae]|jgi:hypothetical protein|uniref:Uncharacterized protein n=2 Tax=Klebsiella pneumoniae complex TaxID=3390273 RepID=A0AAW9PQ68_KLEVA|nr:MULTISPECIES: hypothetical protein [Enterobacteriaceae]EKX3849509.1 hypothetical protein [Klebsiella oxytoca]HBQ3823753.1 hypothetical protein [Salmonella enterica subsp. enterica serovar Senftenberg]HBW1670405.1 hypothetical protein [Klebsiella quasipneumoniae subsp. similipneumoniae]ANE73437.1 hypothetical protein A7B01_27950 [Klebsiella pneumoniae]AVJ89442.1 hypothetical protein CSC00_5657 [Klebsiella pneumoniae]
MKDFIASLNGRDRVFNADALFAKCDRFFPAEISGYPPSLPAGITVQIDKSGSRFDTEKLGV